MLVWYTEMCSFHTHARTHNRLRDLDHYGQVLAHPAFKKDPLGAISQHVKNSVAMGKT